MKKGMARIALLAFVAVWALLGLLSPASAQDVDSGEVEDLAESITEQDPQQVVDAVSGEFNADHLPDGFSEAAFAGDTGTPAAGDVTGAPSPTDIFSVESFEGAVGLVPFSVTAEESEEEGDGDTEAPAEGTIPAEMASFNFYAIYIVVFESEDAAEAALEEARSEEGLEGSGIEVEEADDFGVDGMIGSGSQTEEGVTTGLAIHGSRVGNVAILGVAVNFDATGAEVDVDELEETAKNLTGAGILHLMESVEDL